MTEKTVSPMEEKEEIKKSLAGIDNTIIVLSGKGGVGKSTVAVNLAAALASKGYSAGLLDIDIHGPSIPKLLHIERAELQSDGKKFIPVDYQGIIKVISIGFLIRDADDPVIWRGPLKYGVIRQFLKDVLWGELDFLIIDSPPGTGDEPLSICQMLDDATGAVVVTTPQDVALLDVRKSITFCRKVNMPVLGIVENMSGFVCPHCGERVDIFKTGGGERMAGEMGTRFLGNIPIDEAVMHCGDDGSPVVLKDKISGDVQDKFNTIVENLLNEINGGKK